MLNTDYIIDKFNTINIHLTNTQAEKLYKYYEILVETNNSMNLTSITEFNDVVLKHFIDSCILLDLCKVPVGSTIIDMGTGAGFPGIPLKIVRDDLCITLADSLNKRIGFLNNVIDLLELDNITAIHCRAEDLGHDNDYREKYDYCVSRAVANLSTLSEYCLPFVKVGGKFISYKSGAVSDELDESKKAISILGGNIFQIIDYKLPESDIARSLVLIDKEKSCSPKYPRKSGIPSRKPIK